MPSEKETLEAVRNRIAQRKRALEVEIIELDEMYRVLGAAQKIDERDAGSSRPARQERSSVKTALPYNLNLSAQVDNYIAALQYKDPPEGINLKEMINELKRDHGVKGKDTSLYSYLHSLLKKKASKGSFGLRYEKGVGFYKARPISRADRDDSELVSVSGV